MNIIDIAISSITFLTLKEKILLKGNIDTSDKLGVVSLADISMLISRPLRRVVWNARETLALAERSARIMKTKGISYALYDSADYPALLREILNPPYMIFYRGNVDTLKKKCVSIVGTRNICRKAAEETLKFAKEAALDDVAVISGNAQGVDFFAHKGALDSMKGQSTVAVLPCGIDSVVPTSHKTLAERIVGSGGLLLSEYIPGVPAEKWRFIQRNRLIAALSPATVVMQAPPGSGALITTGFALDYNRDVMFHNSCFCEDALKISKQTVEKKVGKRLSTCEDYIQSGACIIEDYKDFKKALFLAPGTHGARNLELFS